MAKAVKKPRKKAVNGYKLAEPLPQGEILTDITNKQWKLGPFVGEGGFGAIYSAQEASAKSSKKYPYVVKVEPHENGPLFVEMHFYMKNAKPADIDAFKKKHKLKTFGMPAYLGSGSHEVGSNKYRFIVMEKFGTDIEKLRQENGGVFPTAVVFQLAWQMTYVLEYIHEFGYVHADLKGANILMGITPEAKNQAYLVDFGLACKFSTEKQFKPNPKKANDGTIEYLSCDAHQGVPTRRGDFEILGYNIIHWLGGKLPWDSCLKDVKAVQQKKEEAMSNIPAFVKSCFTESKINTSTIVQFFKLVSGIKFNEEPNYETIRNLFKKEVEKNGAKVDGPLEFNSARKRRSVDETVETPEKKTKEYEEEEAPKKVVRRGRPPAKKKEEDEDKTEEVMTDAMKEILAKKTKSASKKKKTKNLVNGTSSPTTDTGHNFEGYTSEMIEIKLKKINGEKSSKSKKKVEVATEDNISSRLRRKKET